jgi:hypothetical protein
MAIIFIIITSASLAPVAAQTGLYAYIETAPVITELVAGNVSWAVGHPNGKGEPAQVAVVADGRVYLFDLGADTLVFQRELIGFPQKVTSLALADYDGDGRDDLWVGMAGSGALYVYSLQEGYALLAEGGRTWSDVKQILTPDLDGDGFADAVLRTASGTIAIFLRRPEGLVSVKIPSAMSSRLDKVAFMAAGDVDQDGHDELILARDRSYVTMWRWVKTADDSVATALQLGAKSTGSAGNPLAEKRRLRPMPATDSGELYNCWEWYPDNPIQYLDIAALGSNTAPKLLVGTRQGVLYFFDAVGTALQSAGSITASWVSSLQYVSPWRSDVSTQMISNLGDKIGIWQVQINKDGNWYYQLIWQNDYSIKASMIMNTNDKLLALAKDGLHVLRRIPQNYIRVIHAGVDVNANVSPIYQGGTLYLPANTVWKDLLGLQLSWNAAEKQLTVMRGLRLLIVVSDSTAAIVDDVLVYLPNPPIIKQNVLYLPLEAVRLIAPEIDWQPRIRLLTVP